MSKSGSASTMSQHERRQRLWRAIHPHAEVGHKAKFWPMRCRCDWCSLGRTRDERATERRAAGDGAKQARTNEKEPA